MIVYRMSYYDGGGGIELHYPTVEQAIKITQSMWRSREDITSIKLEALRIVKPTKKNICCMLDGINYIETRETLISKER